jgi:hypothetical protein
MIVQKPPMRPVECLPYEMGSQFHRGRFAAPGRDSTGQACFIGAAARLPQKIQKSLNRFRQQLPHDEFSGIQKAVK